MGIVNATPDSFSDGGRFAECAAAVAHGLRLLDEGADWIDIGGESTRPGADPVGLDEEIARVIPVIRGILAARPHARVSIDTSKPGVARAAIAAGAALVNDVTALGDPAMVDVCAQGGVGVVLMHMRGAPRTMQQDTDYGDMVGEIADYLARRVERAVAGGIAADRVVVDPGVGFGKAPAANATLIAALPRFRGLGPVLIGASRKAFIGRLTGVASAADRVAGSVGAALAAADLGADILRVHDVLATRHALAVYLAVKRG